MSEDKIKEILLNYYIEMKDLRRRRDREVGSERIALANKYAAQLQALIDEEKEKFGLEVAESERALCRVEIFKEIEAVFPWIRQGVNKEPWQALKGGE